MVKTFERYEKPVIYGIAALYILAGALFAWREFYWFHIFALAPLVVYLAFFDLDRLFLAVVFLTPLSVEMSRLAGGGLPFDISLPTEPLILIILAMMLLRMFYYQHYGPGVLRHPVSLAILFYLLWLLITTITSTMPVVSAKFFLVRLWFIAVFYFAAVRIFSRSGNTGRFLWCYIAALTLVAVYTIYNHAGYGLIAQREAHWVVRPFYNDHTAYGAALAMFLPPLFYLAFRRKGTPAGRRIAAILIPFFVFALVFSYSRAAWVSAAAALAVWIVIRSRMGPGTFVTVTLLAALALFLLRHDIVREMERNTQDSSADFREHVRSITNITSDASNLERINRWHAAAGMFAEKPLFGWGPGTYMFNYAPFQYSYNRTIISTNRADGGDAHSEYLGPLSETGLPGLLSVLAIAFFTLFTGFRLQARLARRDDRLMVTGVLLGLVTYLVHGVLNNFLHSDKLAVPFWGFAAIIVAADLYGEKKKVSGARQGLAEEEDNSRKEHKHS